jgi:predicted house-cleaning NTP pyrophosphatase (Maf/HAM1 superfamily)
MTLYLASASPRRKAQLEQAGFRPFVPPNRQGRPLCFWG